VKNLIIRTISGFVFVCLVIGSIWVHQYAMVAVMAFFALVSQFEFLRMFKNDDDKPHLVFSLFTGLVLYGLVSASIFDLLSPDSLSLILPLIFIGSFIELYRRQKQPAFAISLSNMSLLYVIMPFSMLGLIYTMGDGELQGKVLVTLIFSLIWLNDSSAYLFGTAFGKHRLFERISPKKSWEGAIGGAFVVMISSFVLSRYFDFLNPIEFVGLGLVIVLAATFGDLIESMFKRSKNVKDTGKIMPGHGGLLDRFDAAIFSVPFVYLYLTLVL
jgi:phosphatidate cytidylyltransferase